MYEIRNITAVDGAVQPHTSIHIENDRIAQVGGVAVDCPSVDGQGWYAVPGFIDLQLNGAFGFDFTFQPDSIQQVAARLPQTGCTAFLPTFITSPLEGYPEKCRSVIKAMQTQDGARVLGGHFEGPFLSPKKPGAHDTCLLRNPNEKLLATVYSPLEAVKMVTLAPEVEGGIEAVKWLAQRGVIVSIGHSNADASTAAIAIEAGAASATHLFNAMPTLHHREPALTGIALTSDRLTCGLIADGKHVNRLMIDLAYRACGPQRIALITDAMGAMGMPDGRYQIGGQEVIASNQEARLPDGTLAGAILRMDEAFRNIIEFTSCSLPDAVEMASSTPARLLGLDGQFGHLKPGYAADIVLLDKSLQVKATLVKGNLVYVDAQAQELFSLVC